MKHFVRIPSSRGAAALLVALAALCHTPGRVAAEGPDAAPPAAAAEEKPAADAAGDAMIENPYYARWAAFAPGAWARTRMETLLPGGSVQVVEMMTKLVARSDEQVELESASVREEGGQRIEGAPEKTVFAARSRAVPAAAGAQVETGKETLKVGEKEVATTWRRTTTDQGGMKTTVTEWHSDEVPGGLVQMTTLSEGMITVKSTLVVLEFDAKK